jgi:hypothetical protein
LEVEAGEAFPFSADWVPLPNTIISCQVKKTAHRAGILLKKKPIGLAPILSNAIHPHAQHGALAVRKNSSFYHIMRR